MNPKLFEDSKYIFEDVSNTNAFENYQMRLKITSNRQIKWAKELLIIRLKEFGIKIYRTDECGEITITVKNRGEILVVKKCIR